MFGQIPDFTNGFDFMRRLWGGSGMPGGMMPGLQAMTPPMNLEDLDKRIADLQAVESWLQLNTNLLRTTIQGLEVQRATLVALQTFGKALSPDAMQSAMENVARAANAPSATPPQRAGTDTGTGSRHDAPAPQAAAQPEAQDAAPEATGEGTAEAVPNASVWWDLLQNQFNQIASTAAAASIAPFGMGGMGAFGGAGAPGQPAGAAPEAAPRKTAATDNGGKAGARPAAKSPAKKAPAKTAAKKTTASKSAKGKSPATDAANGNGNGNGGNGKNNGT